MKVSTFWGERIRGSYFQNGNLSLKVRLPQDIPNDRIADPPGDHSKGRFVPVMVNKIERTHGTKLLGNLLEFRVQLFVQDESKLGGWRSIAEDRAGSWPFSPPGEWIESNRLLRVRNPQDRAEDHRDLESLRKVKGESSICWASLAEEGSNTGTFANMAINRVSCSV